MSDKQITVLNNLLSEIEKNIPFKDKKNLSVSKANVGRQLDHTLKVINGVCGILIRTNPSKYKKVFNLIRLFLFPFCYIPKGKAKAARSYY